MESDELAAQRLRPQSRKQAMTSPLDHESKAEPAPGWTSLLRISQKAKIWFGNLTKTGDFSTNHQGSREN